MYVSSFLTPKREVVWVSSTGTVEQALERMKPNGFSAVPILDDDGFYVGTLSTSDLMWFVLDTDRPWLERARSSPLLRVQRRFHGSAVPIDAEVRALVGIVRRRRLIEYCASLAGVGLPSSLSEPKRKLA